MPLISIFSWAPKISPYSENSFLRMAIPLFIMVTTCPPCANLLSRYPFSTNSIRYLDADCWLTCSCFDNLMEEMCTGCLVPPWSAKNLSVESRTGFSLRPPSQYSEFGLFVHHSYFPWLFVIGRPNHPLLRYKSEEQWYCSQPLHHNRLWLHLSEF